MMLALRTRLEAEFVRVARGVGYAQHELFRAVIGTTGKSLPCFAAVSAAFALSPSG